ncbi:ABC transporter substrate-binding protein [Eubacteriales bacterium OttesenSCG-928-K08]|nr:ABC transporter substrate-binding protein [Eubacteriales bacterium OttesenSCG-928-K08]
MKKTLTLVMALLLTLALVLTGCGGNANGGATPEPVTPTDSGTDPAPVETGDDDVIKVGIFEPLTGANAAGGQMELEGIKVAHSLVGEVLGKKIVLVEMDNKSDDVEAVTAAERLVNSEKVDIVVGSWGSSVCIAAGDTFMNAKVPAIGTSCTNPLVTLDNPYYFRVCYLDDFQGTLLANFAKQEGYKTAAVITDVSDTYAIGLKKYFVDAFGAENIVAEAQFNKGDQDFTAQITSVMAANPEVIFAPSGYAEAGLMMKQAADLGYNILFLGADTWETEVMFEVGGVATENCRFTTFFDADAAPTPESTQFLTAYEAMFGGKPKGAVTALGYDAYMVAIAAIEKAGTTDGEALQKALTELDVTGVTGRCVFDENGDAVKNQAIIKTVQDGGFKYISTVVVD